jgi:DNA polymerase III subunit alpha
MASSVEIAAQSTATLPRFQELKYPTGGEPIDKMMWRWLKEGWAYRQFDRLPRHERAAAKARVRLEFDLMKEKGFLDYFAVISDLVRWAKDHGIPVGPARGSAAASLACYLWRITEVQPLLFPNLIFERFIDANRHDLPDVDLDFDDEQRYRVRDYLEEKYGSERVGNIGTFVMYKGKNSLEDVARVNAIPPSVVEELKGMLIERSSGDLRAAATITDSIEMFPKVAKLFDAYPKLRDAQRLEGNLKGFSVHAAGLVVANEPLANNLAVYTRHKPKTNEIVGSVLSIDKYAAEDIGALKIDALGLTTMGVIRRCLDYVGMTLEELYAVPLDDENVYQAFRDNRVVGIFQFDGRAMRSVNREVKPDTFAEVCDINALARPGPLHSGAAAEYIMAKHKKKRVERLHPIVTEITAHTQGQIVYQEQILRVVRELGGFSWEEAANVRKLISKKQGEQAFNRLQSKFLAGSADLGVSEAVARRVWKQLVTAGAYAFNAAHCVSYGMLAYWTMWLKVNHPQAFYCAALQKYEDKQKVLDLLKEAKASGIRILPPHPLRSETTWRPTTVKGQPALRAGLTQVKGIGDTMAPAMLAYRAEHGAREWLDFLGMKGFGQGKLNMIEEFCALGDPFGIDTLRKALEKVRAWLWRHPEEGVPMPTSRSDDVPYEAIRGEHVWVGKVLNINLKDIYELHRSRTGDELDPAEVREPEYVNYVVITGEDETGPLHITVHRWGGFYESVKDVIWDLNPETDLLLVKGYKRKEYRRAIYATEVHVLKLGEPI